MNRTGNGRRAALLLVAGLAAAAASCPRVGDHPARQPRPGSRGSRVPLVEVAEELQVPYRFSSTIGTFALTLQEGDLVFVLSSDRVYRGDRVHRLSGPVLLQEDRVMVPPDGVDLVLSLVFGRRVRWAYGPSGFSVQRPGGTETEDRPSPQPRQSVPGRAVSGEIRSVVVDAGHGGKDPGGVGVGGMLEKDLTLEVSAKLAEELRRKHRVNVVMTREEDRFLTLEERGEIANRVDPRDNPLFVSVHVNVSFSERSRGYESYYLSLDPFGEQARDVASMENSVLAFEIEDYSAYLREVVNRIVDVEYRRESMKLAHAIQKGMARSSGSPEHDRGVKGAFFYVLKMAKMPGVLVEIGFITNAEEAANLADPAYQGVLARGIADGVGQFMHAFRQTGGFTQ
ncbi:MAG: N-acetylmuramoyl-L-alanine amidase [Spirochaetota bacterium]